MKKLIKLFAVLVLSFSLTLPLTACNAPVDYYYYMSPYGGEEHFMVYIGEIEGEHSFNEVFYELKSIFEENGWTILMEYMEEYHFYAYRPVQYELRLIEGGERQYGFFFYTYEMVYANPFIDLVEEYEDAIERFFEKFPSFKTNMLYSDLNFHIISDSAFFRADSDERFSDLYGRYYHKWQVTYSSSLRGADTITLRQYRLNTDGWYTLAIALAAVFVGIVIATSRKDA